MLCRGDHRWPSSRCSPWSAWLQPSMPARPSTSRSPTTRPARRTSRSPSASSTCMTDDAPGAGSPAGTFATTEGDDLLRQEPRLQRQGVQGVQAEQQVGAGRRGRQGQVRERQDRRRQGRRPGHGRRPGEPDGDRLQRRGQGQRGQPLVLPARPGLDAAGDRLGHRGHPDARRPATTATSSSCRSRPTSSSRSAGITATLLNFSTSVVRHLQGRPVRRPQGLLRRQAEVQGHVPLHRQHQPKTATDTAACKK